VPGERDVRSRNWNILGANRAPRIAATSRKPMATPRMTATSRTETDPSDTRRTTTVRMINPSTSSTTAAPSTVRASTVASARRSLNTRAVIPTLVAARAAPMNNDSLPVWPSALTTA
jgi:hypothetical protein